MTPREFNIYVQAAKARREADLRLLAIHAAWIINNRTPALGEKHRRKVTPDELLGRPKEVPLLTSPEEFRAYMRRRAEGLEE